MGEMCGLGHGAATSEEVRGAMAAGRTGNDLHSALPWAVKKPRGLSDDEPIHTLWQNLGSNWLSGSSQNNLLELL